MTKAEREAVAWFTLKMESKGTLDAENQQKFDKWLLEPENEGAYRRLERSGERADAAKGSAEVANSRLTRARFYQRERFRNYAVAASAFLMIGGLGVTLYERGDFATPQAQTEIASYATHVGERQRVVLGDGSRVTLDAGSVLRVRYSPDARRLVLEKGRALFEVAHDSARPFIVHAGDGNIVAHGTVFDVSVGPSSVRVILIQGVVEVSKDKDAGKHAPSSVRRLTPGQQVTFDKNGPITEPKPVAHSALQWLDGRLSFNRARLADAVAEFNRHSKRKIVLATPDLGDLPVTGGFQADDSESFAESVAANFGLAVAATPDQIVLSSKPPESRQ